VKITVVDVTHVHVNEKRGNWTFVRVNTDEGISGLGEVSHVRAPLEVEAAAKRLEPSLIGTDPFNIEGFIQTFGVEPHLHVPSHLIAMSGVEQALWDIKGKALGVPVYELLGGAVRDKVRLYANVNRKAVLEPTPEGFAQATREAIEDGFAAVKFSPFWGLMDEDSITDGRLKRSIIDTGLERVRAVREAVGPEVDVLLQLGVRNMSFHQMVELADELAQFNPFWYQTTFPKVEDNARFVQHTPVPVTSPARGGFQLGRGRWCDWFEHGAMNITNPDLMNVGGIWEMKKIATIAEAWGVAFSPHSPYGPVHFASNVHLCASVTNFCILEYSGYDAPWRSAVTVPPEEIRNGYAIVPDRPGLGLELDEDVVAKRPLGPHPALGGWDPVFGIWGGGRRANTNRR